MTQETILNQGMALAELYQEGQMRRVIKEVSKDARVAVATMISLPSGTMQTRFAEKVINGK